MNNNDQFGGDSQADRTDSQPIATRWVLLIAAAFVAFFIDVVNGTNQFLHQGPFGFTFIWTPGSTVLYLAFFVILMQFTRGDTLEGLAR